MVQKWLSPEASVGTILSMQFGAACIAMWCGLACFGRLPVYSIRNVLNVAWGLLAPGLALVLVAQGAARTDGVSVALISGILPVLGPILARLLLREPLHWSFPVGGMIGFSGLAAIVLNRQAFGTSDETGNILVLLGVMCSAFSHVIGRKLNTGVTPWYQTATLQVTGGTVVAFIFAAATSFDFPDIREPGQAAAVIYLAFGMTLLNFLAFNLALARIPAAWVSLYSTLAPAIGTLAAYLLLGSQIGPSDLAGIAVIIAGAAFPHVMRIMRLAPA